MKRISIVFSILFIVTASSAQSVLSLGLRGGADFLMPQTDQKAHTQLGVAGSFDIGYTYYWPTQSGDWGIRTGVSIGYSHANTQVDFSHQYTQYDYIGNEMLYTTSGTINAALQRVFSDVPIMLAFRYNGFAMQIGLKAQLTAWSQSRQQLQNPIIDAYYVPYNVHVINELITGEVATEDMKEQTQGRAPFFSFLVAGQIGYEAKLKEDRRIGIAAYVNYNVWNTFPSSDPQPVIAVSPIKDPVNPAPTVTINNPFTSVISAIHPLQVGITIYYNFEFGAKHKDDAAAPELTPSPELEVK